MAAQLPGATRVRGFDDMEPLSILKCSTALGGRSTLMVRFCLDGYGADSASNINACFACEFSQKRLRVTARVQSESAGLL